MEAGGNVCRGTCRGTSTLVDKPILEYIVQSLPTPAFPLLRKTYTYAVLSVRSIQRAVKRSLSLSIQANVRFLALVDATD